MTDLDERTERILTVLLRRARQHEDPQTRALLFEDADDLESGRVVVMDAGLVEVVRMALRVAISKPGHLGAGGRPYPADGCWNLEREYSDGYSCSEKDMLAFTNGESAGCPPCTLRHAAKMWRDAGLLKEDD